MSSPTQAARPRSRTMLSFGSRKSSGSSHKFTKEELEEASKDKPWKKMTTKANPNIAVAELEPVAQALEKPTMTSNIRSMSFNDQFGNPITDPDRSNPTRPRLERPLDTIRSFEAAIDGSYNRRNSRAFEAMSPPQSRPSSFYPGASNGYGPRFPAEGSNHGNRMAPGRPESYVDPYGNRQSPLPFSNRRRSYASRNNPDPAMFNNHANSMHNQYHPPQPPYAANLRREPHYQQPYDAATQGSSSGGSHGTEPWSTSTDPSSEASSVERLQQMQPPAPPKHADLGEQYGFNGFGGAPAALENGHDPMMYGTAGNGLDRRPQPQMPMQKRDLPPPPPPHLSNNNVVRQPVRANTLQRKNPGKQPDYETAVKRPEIGEKRKSWLMRRFSKKD